MGVPTRRYSKEYGIETSRDVARRLSGICQKVHVLTDSASFVRMVVIDCEQVPDADRLCERFTRTDRTFYAVSRERWSRDFAAFRFRGVLFHLVSTPPTHGGPHGQARSDSADG